MGICVPAFCVVQLEFGRGERAPLSAPRVASQCVARHVPPTALTGSSPGAARADDAAVRGRGLDANPKNKHQNAIVAEFNEAIKYNDAIKANLSKVQVGASHLRSLRHLLDLA